ncbi:hypothetical protein KF707_22790, partial [Candidatus Obscuribacterales bacterium]|nr:hypothetical protein [Candidatus Obscuribacterales bacterium]
ACFEKYFAETKQWRSSLFNKHEKLLSESREKRTARRRGQMPSRQTDESHRQGSNRINKTNAKKKNASLMRIRFSN